MSEYFEDNNLPEERRIENQAKVTKQAQIALAENLANVVISGEEGIQKINAGILGGAITFGIINSLYLTHSSVQTLIGSGSMFIAAAISYQNSKKKQRKAIEDNKRIEEVEKGADKTINSAVLLQGIEKRFYNAILSGLYNEEAKMGITAIGVVALNYLNMNEPDTRFLYELSLYSFPMMAFILAGVFARFKQNETGETNLEKYQNNTNF